MTQQNLYLGIDCGTQGTKAIVLDASSGKVLGLGAASHTLISGANGRREQHTQEWLDAFTEATHRALQQAGVDGQDILAIGVSGQQHGLVLLDDQGQVLRPAKLWCDTETAPENDRLLQHLGGESGSLERLGVAIAPGYTVSKLLWTREQHPEVFARIAHILLPHDYLNYWLTGRACAEYGDASGTGYFNVRTREWDLALLRHIDPDGRLEAALPELIEANQPVGTILPAIAERLGINPNARVSSGGGDNMMGAIGTGNTREGVITASFGTSGTIYACAEKPVVDPLGEIAAFCDSTNRWLPLLCTMNVTVATELMRNYLGWTHERFSAAIARVPPGCKGLMLLPYLEGERTPNVPAGTGVFLGVNQRTWLAEHFARAAME
ncbi:MAG: xylulokinase, partial [Pseudomonas sp.]